MNETGYFFLIWGFDAMTSGRLRLGWLVVAVLGLCVAGASAGADGDMLWRIGTQDDAAAEFRHGPGGYNNYDADGRFVVGESDPAEAWPYCHPGAGAGLTSAPRSRS